MRTSTLIATGAFVGAALLSGCGGDGNSAGADDYCGTLKASAAEIKDFTAADATPDFSTFDDFVASARDLAKQAPEAIEEEWAYVVDALNELTSALDDADVEIGELITALTAGQMPEGVDPADMTALGTKLQGLTSEKLSESTDAIDKHAKDECGVDLSTS